MFLKTQHQNTKRKQLYWNSNSCVKVGDILTSYGDVSVK